ncbi:hypothetical protein M1328_04400 [Patescibacteria group bacterium]|nr:hypothetical protein [Patescibacteria group bacterium]
MKNFLLFMTSLAIGVLIALGYFAYAKSKPAGSMPKPTVLDFSVDIPPKDSLKGNVSQLSGDVFWESRSATSPALIKNLKAVQQGESLQTSDNGKIALEFPGAAAINMANNSMLSIIQTLPANLVFEQMSGKISFEKTGQPPLSARVFHLLVSIDGTATIDINKTNQRVTVTDNRGDSTLGFEDINNVSQVIKLTAGQQYVFDDESRSGEVIGL